MAAGQHLADVPHAVSSGACLAHYRCPWGLLSPAVVQATFNTLIASIMKREIQFKTTEKTVMASTVTDAANKAKSRAKNSWAARAWTPVQV